MATDDESETVNLLIFMGRLESGGAQRQTTLMAKALAKRGHAVSLVTLHPGGQYWDEIRTEPSIRTVALFDRRPGKIRLAIQLLIAPAKLRAECKRADAIYSVLLIPNLIALFAAGSAMRNRLAWGFRASSYRQSLMQRVPFFLCRLLSSSVSIIIVNSMSGMKLLRDAHFAPQRFAVIFNGIDVDRYTYSADSRSRIRGEMWIPESAFVVGHVARFHPVKAHGTFLRSATQALVRNKNLYFMLVGAGVDEANSRLTDLIPDSCRERFILLGERRDVPDLMSAMDVFCLSSTCEGFPNVLAEAMSAGLPCIATDVGDSAVLLDDHGTIVPVEDVAGMAAAICDLVAGDFRSGSSDRRRTVSELYSVERMASSFEREFLDLAAQGA